MVHLPKSKATNVAGIAIGALLVPLTITLVYPLSLLMVLVCALALAAAYLALRAWGRRSRAAHDVAVYDGFSFGDAVQRMHEKEQVQALANKQRREGTAGTP